MCIYTGVAVTIAGEGKVAERERGTQMIKHRRCQTSSLVKCKH